ncbi:MAG: rRNA cytosine-C5-methyltransferase [Salibacteraceae bacterium]
MESIPVAFVEALREHFPGAIADRVLSQLDAVPSTSVRLNDAKDSNRFRDDDLVPWTKKGRLLSVRPEFSKDPLLHAGAYYVQDSSSMILEHILEQLTVDSDGLLALDLCAAPGGKSIILSDYLQDKGFLLANEIDQKRNAVLTENLLKWGSTHHAVSQLSAAKLGQLENTFDLVLIDAPCSGEGMFRKDAFARTQWNADLVESCAKTQQDLVQAINPAIRSGGYLIYSTCTMNVRENEEQIKQALQMGYKLVNIDMSGFEDRIITASNAEDTLGWYLLPGISTGEGLFISVLQKTRNEDVSDELDGLNLPEFTSDLVVPQGAFTNQWSKKDIVYGVADRFWLLSRLPGNMAFKSVGLPVYQAKHTMQIPQHGLAMLPQQNVDIHLDLDQALDYLRGETLRLTVGLSKPWSLVGFENVPLGWVKVVPDRLNNHYPKHFRLRK